MPVILEITLAISSEVTESCNNVELLAAVSDSVSSLRRCSKVWNCRILTRATNKCRTLTMVKSETAVSIPFGSGLDITHHSAIRACFQLHCFVNSSSSACFGLQFLFEFVLAIHGKLVLLFAQRLQLDLNRHYLSVQLRDGIRPRFVATKSRASLVKSSR